MVPFKTTWPQVCYTKNYRSLLFWFEVFETNKLNYEKLENILKEYEKFSLLQVNITEQE